MADFICFEAEAEEGDVDIINSGEEDDGMIIDDDFIDNTHQENDSSVFHRFHNQTTNTSDIMEELLREEEAISDSLEAHNYIDDNEIDEKLTKFMTKQKIFYKIKISF